MGETEDLHSLPRPKWAIHEIAIVGGSREDEFVIAAGFLRVAEAGARRWIEHGPDDRLPIPILYNYRHGIELTLKWLIRLTARCAVRGGYTGPENLSPLKLDEKLRTHNIRKLADRLDRYMGLLELEPPNNRIDNASRQLLDWLDSEDETGETYRYSTVGHGEKKAAARPVQTNLNFYELVREVHELATLLHAGYAGFLDNHEQMQIDYYVDMRDLYADIDFAPDVDHYTGL
ncbi:hypothetical protein ACFZBU_38785 [Embleya sp. NPDC008237]|uniref:hypothetical protein n=1 Tax=Embleya sp. NPDC008237 TaxID=3363978 RepID=UPI0036E53345